MTFKRFYVSDKDWDWIYLNICSIVDIERVDKNNYYTVKIKSSLINSSGMKFTEIKIIYFFNDKNTTSIDFIDYLSELIDY